MSDFYLVLRRRLDHVTDWVLIETDVLKQARRRRGLSYEGVARLLHVSSKTYERYETRGRVPRHVLPSLAEILELEIEIERPAPLRVPDRWTPADDLSAEIIARLDRIEKLLRDRPAS